MRPKKCFTNIQQRRFWAPLSTLRLCPSMDLIVHGLQSKQPASAQQAPTPAATAALHIHRTLNWQKIAVVASAPDGPALTSETPIASAGASAAHHADWRPDGRFLAVATANAVSLYSLEGLLKAAGTQDPHSVGDAATGMVHTCSFPVHSASTITSLTWLHVGCGHPSWPDAVGDDDFRPSADDRIQYVLPPSEYHGSGGAQGDEHRDDAVVPTSQTPLSVLCVSTTTNGVHLFFHGRYAIAYNVPLNAAYSSIVASTDLTHFIAAESPSSITILSIAALSRHRYDLQTISTQYCSVMQHLEAVRSSLPEITASWRSSLKAVDLKLDGLQTLFSEYGLVVDTGKGVNDAEAIKKCTVCSLLVQYILSGHTRAAPTLSNAVDQFFTGVQMNDQLVQRMERSLAGAVANIESTVRKQLLAPATALVYEIDRLYGLAAFRSDLLPTTTTLQLLHSAQQLLLSVDTALTALVEARGRLRDFCAWLRCTGAQIKARGTAANSVQRENAKKRRVPATVVNLMLAYLQQPATDEFFGRGTTETVLGLRFADLLRETSISVTELRPVSPASVVATSLVRATPTVPHVLAETFELADKVFEHPRTLLAQSILRTEIGVPEVPHKILAVTTRLGQGGIDADQVAYGEDQPDGFFLPPTVDPPPSFPNASDFRQWSVLAQMLDNSILQLHAFPLSWTMTANDVLDDEIVDGLATEFAWTVQMSLPSEYTIRDLAFYGDDGKSSLSSGIDFGSVQEGRQRLGLLVSRKNYGGIAQPLEADTESVELWVVPYDDLEYACVALQKDAAVDHTLFRCDPSSSPGSCTYKIRPTPEASGFDNCDLAVTNLEERILYARTREVFDAMDFSSTEQARPCRLVLSGSRGIGAVCGNQKGGTVLEILDLEEDEEVEEAEAMDAEVEEE